VSIRENHRRCSTRLIDANHDVAVRDQLLDLEGVHLAITREPFQEDENGVAGFIIRHWYGSAAFVVTYLRCCKEKSGRLCSRATAVATASESCRYGACGDDEFIPGRVPDLHHQLTTGIRIGGEDLLRFASTQ
jgi:hypothetical protein